MQQRFSSLDFFDQKLLLAQFFQEFVKSKLAAENMLKDKKIEIRFAYFVNRVVSRKSSFLDSSGSHSITVHGRPEFY